MHASPKQQIASEGDLEVVPVFIVLRRRVRELSDPLEPKLDREYVLGHLTDLTENQVLTIAEQVSQLAFRQAGFNDVIALADSFDATNQARRLELLSKFKDLKSLLSKRNNQPDIELLWPHRLALVVQEMARDCQKENAKRNRKKNNKKLGRKKAYDPKCDDKISEAWSTRQHKTYLDLARARGKGETSNDIRRALDRVRNRHQRK